MSTAKTNPFTHGIAGGKARRGIAGEKTQGGAHSIPDPLVMLSTRLPSNLVRDLKVLSATSGEPIQQLLQEAVQDILAKRSQ